MIPADLSDHCRIGSLEIIVKGDGEEMKITAA